MKYCHIVRVNLAQKELKSLYKKAIDKQDMSQSDILKEKEKILGRVREIKTMPQYALQGLEKYFQALYDLMDENQVFLYCVGGKMYRTHLAKTGPASLLPCWDELPREVYCNLQDNGGLYWADTLNKYF